MPVVSTCPKCEQQVMIPDGIDREALVRCPLCEAEFPLGEAMTGLPPVLVPLGAAFTEPMSAASEAESELAGGEEFLSAPLGFTDEQDTATEESLEEAAGDSVAEIDLGGLGSSEEEVDEQEGEERLAGSEQGDFWPGSDVETAPEDSEAYDEDAEDYREDTEDFAGFQSDAGDEDYAVKEQPFGADEDYETESLAALGLGGGETSDSGAAATRPKKRKRSPLWQAAGVVFGGIGGVVLASVIVYFINPKNELAKPVVWVLSQFSGGDDAIDDASAALGSESEYPPDPAPQGALPRQASRWLDSRFEELHESGKLAFSQGRQTGVVLRASHHQIDGRYPTIADNGGVIRVEQEIRLGGLAIEPGEVLQRQNEWWVKAEPSLFVAEAAQPSPDELAMDQPGTGGEDIFGGSTPAIDPDSPFGTMPEPEPQPEPDAATGDNSGMFPEIGFEPELESFEPSLDPVEPTLEPAADEPAGESEPEPAMGMPESEEPPADLTSQIQPAQPEGSEEPQREETEPTQPEAEPALGMEPAIEPQPEDEPADEPEGEASVEPATEPVEEPQPLEPAAEEPAEAEPVAQPEPAKPIGPKEQPSFMPEEVSQAIQTAEQAVGGQEDQSQLSPEAFGKLVEMAEVWTFAPEQAVTDERRQAVEALSRQLIEHPGDVRHLGTMAGERLTDPAKPTGGIVLPAICGRPGQLGGLHGAKVQVLGHKATVLVLSDQPLPFGYGDQVLILGSLVHDPAENLRDFSLAQPVVVWVGTAVKIPNSGGQ